MTLPDYNVLSNSLLIASEQIKLIPNIAPLNTEQQIHNQLTMIREILDEQFNRLREDLNARYSQLEVSFRAEQDSSASILNSFESDIVA